MSNIVTIGYSTEGTTDKRFLENIIKRTFEDIAFLCNGIIEVYDPVFFGFQKSLSFVDGVSDLSRRAYDGGINILCIHVDADSKTDEKVFTNKLNPSLSAILQMEDNNVCKNIVPIVPIQMTEAWILANKKLLKDEMNTTLSDSELQINRVIENISDPKTVIENAIRISQESVSHRRRKLTISDIYQPMGQKLSISDLESLDSYLKFKNSVLEAFKKLNYLS